MVPRPFRFGLTLVQVGSRAELADKARRAEDEGWSVLNVADHLNMPAPFPLLAHVAAVTERIRLGTLVINNDWRSLAILAQDAATTDLLSDGRLELGLGTGYAANEYDSGGYRFRPGRERVAELEATLLALRKLFSGETVTAQGMDPALTDHTLAPLPPQGAALPLLIGGNGDRLLTFAAQHADIVAFTGFSFPDGRAAAMTHITSSGLADRVRLVARAAAGAGRDPERNLLVQVAAVGTRAETEPARARARKAYRMSDAEIDDVPLLLIGETSQVVEKIHALRERFGITYLAFLEPAISNLGPVLEQLVDR